MTGKSVSLHCMQHAILYDCILKLNVWLWIFLCGMVCETEFIDLFSDFKNYDHRNIMQIVGEFVDYSDVFMIMK